MNDMYKSNSTTIGDVVKKLNAIHGQKEKKINPKVKKRIMKDSKHNNENKQKKPLKGKE